MDSSSKKLLNYKKHFKDTLKKQAAASFIIEDTKQKLLKKSILYSLLAPASHFRALLSLSATACLGQKESQILDWAVAIEMFHTGTLIHDDLPCMDKGHQRRGKLCNHHKFEEDVALLAGCSLFIQAFSFVNKLQKPFLIDLFIAKTGFASLMSGQLLDLKEKSLSHSKHLQMIKWKTASLIEASLEGPALLWAKNKAQKQALTDYGTCLGMAYQMADDLLDKDNSFKYSEKLLKQYTKDSLKALSPFKEKASLLKNLSLKNEQRGLKK